MNKRLFILALALALSVGCAKSPPPDVTGPRQLVARAYALGADHLAPSSYQQAAEALRRAEAALARDDSQAARQALVVAEFYAREAIALAQQQRARQEQELRAREQQREQQQQSAAAAAPRPRVATAPAPARSRPPAANGTQPTPAPTPGPALASSHTVGVGETLWTIAGRPEVYGDHLLWPLLYKANRDQIRDPRQVHVGQILDIPRDVDAREIEEVRAQARQSELFPVPR